MATKQNRKRSRLGMAQASAAAGIFVFATASSLPWTLGFTLAPPLSVNHHRRPKLKLSDSDNWGNANANANEDEWTSGNKDATDWNDPNAWSTFESSEEEGLEIGGANDSAPDPVTVDDSELWLDALAAISAEEIEFNQKDNDRADKARQMQEWGFDAAAIENTFGVALDDSLETRDEPGGMREYRLSLYEDDEQDEATVESHAGVEIDAETGEPLRQQMVYVDEHACIGCTNCATIAQSTFFMEPGFGRARVFRQWGDSETTIRTAIETCPVDCIHYVPFAELVALEIDRRDQRINNQARLVNQGESAHMASTGGNGFTAPQAISGNAGSRCANCPTRGCKTCPMFGVGKNPEYERRERRRLAKLQRARLERERAANSKTADL